MTAATRLGQPADPIETADREDVLHWSVTSIIGVLDKPALLYWAAEQTAVAAVGSQATWRGMLSDCAPTCTHDSAACPAVKWLRDARFRAPKIRLSAADLGTVVHTLAEAYALDGMRPDRERIESEVRARGGANVDVASETDVVSRMLDQFDGWLQRATPSYQATEVAVYHTGFRYAGTADAFLQIDGVRFIADYKTSREGWDSNGNPRRPYSEVALQLAAYRHAELAAVWRPRRLEKFRRRYYALSAAEKEMAVPVPEVDAGVVIHITPEACEAYPVRCDTQVHRSFLFVLEAARWVLEGSRTAVGDPLEYPERTIEEVQL